MRHVPIFWLFPAALVGCDGPSAEPAPNGPPAPTSSSEPSIPSFPDQDRDGSADAADCAPSDPTVFPGAPDRCGDDRVTDCNRTSDDGLVTVDSTLSFTDLQAALDVAGPGAEVRVCPGIHIGPFVAGQGVNLVSHAGADVTVLDGLYGQSPTLTTGGDTTVTGFTIQNGGAGGVRHGADSTLTLTDCRILWNHGGGLLLQSDVTATLVRTTVAENRAQLGGGVFAARGTVIDATGSVIEGNHAEFGAGVYLNGATLIGGSVSENRALDTQAASGGGLASVGQSEVVGTDIGFNQASDAGGGTWTSSGKLTLTDVRIHDNVAVWGGGASAHDSSLVLAGTTELADNTAEVGGGLDVQFGTLDGGRVTTNQSDAGGGGYLQASDVTGTVFEGNEADLGGGAYAAYGESVSFTDVTVTGNHASGEGGGMVIWIAGRRHRATLTRVVITDNSADVLGGGVTLRNHTVFDGCTVTGNVAPTGGGAYWWGDGPVRSIDSDWGSDGSDNAVDDLYDVSTESSNGGFGNAASFDCVEFSGCSVVE